MSDFLNEREQARTAAMDDFRASQPPLPKPEKRPMTPKATARKHVVSLPERQLKKMSVIAARLAHQWTAVEATAAAMAPPTITATSNEPGRANSTPNPTAAIALGHPAYDELLEAIWGSLQQLIWIDQRANILLRQQPVVAREAMANKARFMCADPLCELMATRSGLCRRHYDEERNRLSAHTSPGE